jgi:DNA-binding LacI/PurR family transcriptional regulator
VDHSTEQMGQLAAKLALDRIADPAQPPQTILLQPTLIVRQSSVSSRKSRG